MNNPLKSILIEGTLTSGEIMHKLCPDYFQIQAGIWEVAIHSVSIEQALDKDYIFNISSDLVLKDEYKLGKLQRSKVILNQFKINKDVQKEVIYNINPLWFLINNGNCEHFTIFFKEWPTNLNTKPKDLMPAIVGITMLFRRVI